MIRVKLISREEAMMPGLGIMLGQRPSCGATGFPSPADDYLEGSLDLEDYFQVNKTATFYARASGESMRDYAISDGDLLVIDRSLQYASGDVVVVSLNGELLVKVFSKKPDGAYLLSGNKEYPPIKVEDMELIIWGVVKHVVKDLKGKGRD